MQFIQEKFSLLYQKVKQLCSDYRITITTVILITFYVVMLLLWEELCIETDLGITEFLFQDLIPFSFLLLFVLASMLTESLFPYGKTRKQRTLRIMGFTVGAVIAAVFVWGIIAGNKAGKAELIFQLPGNTIFWWCGRFVSGYLLLLLLSILYVCHQRSGMGFIGYGLHIFVNFVMATGIYFLLLIGVNLVILVVNLLFLGGSSSLNAYASVLITGIYYVPACIMSVNRMDYETDNRLGILLTKYVFSVMTVCALAVVYVYLLKILIMWEMPSNEIYGIAAGLFCLGMPVWILDYYYRDETKYMRFLQKLPYGLIPVILVQAYAICVRIYHNGMTPARYLGTALVLFEIIMLFVWYFWKEKLERVLLIMGAGIITAVFLPYINMYSMSDRWQGILLKTYYDKAVSGAGLTRKEYERLEGAYEYLKWDSVKEDLTKQYDIYNADFAKKLVNCGIEEENLTKKQYHSIHCCQMVGTLDIDGYSSFDMLDQDSRYRYSGKDKVPVDFSAFRFYKRGSEGADTVTVDLSDFMERCIAYEKEHSGAGKEEFSEALKPYSRICLDGDRVLYINHFEVDYRDGIEEGTAFFEIVMVDISAVLLCR